MTETKKRGDIAEIYALRDPRTGAIRYIGKANDAQARLRTHIRDARRRNTPVYAWVRKLAGIGLVPVVEVLEKTENWQEAECRLIAVSRARGDDLLNVAPGGDQPECPDSVRSENGRRLAAAIASDPLLRWICQSKRTISHGLRSGQVSNATRAKLRLAAAKRPDLFGVWLTIPDRNEHASAV